MIPSPEWALGIAWCRATWQLFVPSHVACYLTHAAFKDPRGLLCTLLGLFLFLAPFRLVQRPVRSSCLGLLEIQSLSPPLSRTAGTFWDHCSPQMASEQTLDNCMAHLVSLLSGVIVLCNLSCPVWKQLFCAFYQFSSRWQQKGMAELCGLFVASYRKSWAPCLTENS